MRHNYTITSSKIYVEQVKLSNTIESKNEATKIIEYLKDDNFVTDMPEQYKKDFAKYLIQR
jgi:hypothetical protein